MKRNKKGHPWVNASQLTLLSMFGDAVMWPPPPRAGED